MSPLFLLPPRSVQTLLQHQAAAAAAAAPTLGDRKKKKEASQKIGRNSTGYHLLPVTLRSPRRRGGGRKRVVEGSLTRERRLIYACAVAAAFVIITTVSVVAFSSCSSSQHERERERHIPFLCFSLLSAAISGKDGHPHSRGGKSRDMIRPYLTSPLSLSLPRRWEEEGKEEVKNLKVSVMWRGSLSHTHT